MPNISIPHHPRTTPPLTKVQANFDQEVSARSQDTIQGIGAKVGALLNELSSQEKMDVLKHVLTWADQEEAFKILLRKQVLSQIADTTPVTRGQEWEIYYIDLNGMMVVVAKKRPGSSKDNEESMHQLAYDVSRESISGIKVPYLIDSFNQKNDEDNIDGYLVMERVNGKTLYCMTLEKIAEQFLLRDLPNFETIFSYLINRDGNIHFENDSHAEDQVNLILLELCKQGIINENPWMYYFDGWRKVYPAIEGIYKKYLSKIELFTDVQKYQIRSKIRLFIEDLQKISLHHRDLSGNPRNIMFQQTENLEYTPYIIDWGKASIWDVDTIYYDELYGGNYDKDMDMPTKIQYIGSEIKDKNTTRLSLRELASINNSYTHTLGGKSASHLDRKLHVNKWDFQRIWWLIGLFETLLTKQEKSKNWYLHLRNMTANKQLENEKAYEKIFFFLWIASEDERNNLKERIETGKHQKITTREYQISAIFEKYMKQYEESMKNSSND